ncbi:uncharacterized protein LOC105838801 [Monomorium pharaonis]|uniref:uncharacterized protein LOC105838801 n=1 Tax=Monomorium pharaonis TaxID=307658 RepID=UPI001747A5DC|nr:uncharacterized protein LOC105838801 [Monomorium pharaonis]
MERLILLCLLSPAIFAQLDPNDEPFLPIHPVYPYSPKVIKRGTEGEANPQLTSELYVAPKVDAKDTYTSSYSSNYQRDSYPDYNPHLTNSTLAFGNPSYNGGEVYVYSNVPYPAYNSYPAPYAANPVPSYPNYYYQLPYYYPHYFSHALFPPPLPPPLASGVDYHETSQAPVAKDDKQNADKKGERPRETEVNQDAPAASQFVDGGNYIAGNSRDLDVQSSTYKVASPYNQLPGWDIKTVPISLPKTTYRVISVGAQPVGLDYSLPAVKTQQIEQMTNQVLADIRTQNARQQAGRSYESSRDTLNSANDGSYENQATYNLNAPSYVSLPVTRTKPVTYVINSVGITKVNKEQTKDPNSSHRAPSKNTNAYTPKLSQTRLQTSNVSPESGSNHHARVSDGRPAGQTDKYGNYGASQSYGGTHGQSGSKQEQNYGTYQRQPVSYQSEGFTVAPQIPRSFTYQYSAYQSDQVQQLQQDEVNINHGNFGIKQYKR